MRMYKGIMRSKHYGRGARQPAGSKLAKRFAKHAQGPRGY